MGPDQASGKVKIYLDRYTAVARRLLLARYGNAVVVATQTIGKPVRLNRRNDLPPFNGGDRLDNTCSSGPTVIGNHGQTTYMLSAGRCAVLGATINTHRQLMGHVVSRQLANGSIDAESVNDLGGSYNGSVWGGGPTEANPPSYIEDGSLFAQPRSLVTNDSATSGEIRGISVIAVSQMLTVGGITTVLRRHDRRRRTSRSRRVQHLLLPADRQYSQGIQQIHALSRCPRAASDEAREL